jgi:hypothetical protein
LLVTDSNISSSSYGDFLIKLSKQSNGLTVLEMIKIRNSIENNTRKMDTCCLGVILKLVAMVIASCYMYHHRVILSNHNMGFKTIFVFKDVPKNSCLYCTTEIFFHVKKIFVILGVKGERQSDLRFKILKKKYHSDHIF